MTKQEFFERTGVEVSDNEFWGWGTELSAVSGNKYGEISHFIQVLKETVTDSRD